jgi:hypothetical protein
MATKKMDALVDETVEATFPASDPPSYMAGASVPGSPSRAGVVGEAVFTEFLDPGENVDPRTRERAYFLWEQEGRPEGCADEHWHAAQREGNEGKA